MHQYCWKNNWWLLLNHSHEFFINLIRLQGPYTHTHTHTHTHTRTHACVISENPHHGKEQPNMTFGKCVQTKQREVSAHESTQKYTYRVLRGDIISSMPNICWHIYNFNRRLVGHRDALSASWACACASLTAAMCVCVCVCACVYGTRRFLFNIATCNFKFFSNNICGQIWMMVWLAFALGQAHNVLLVRLKCCA